MDIDKDLNEILDVLSDVIAQACSRPDGTIDSLLYPEYADAIRLLVRYGRLEIQDDYGRRVIGTFTPAASAER